LKSKWTDRRGRALPASTLTYTHREDAEIIPYSAFQAKGFTIG